MKRLKEIVLAASAGFAIGCAKDEGPHLDMHSPQYGIGIISNGYAPDVHLTDQKYESVLECLGMDPQAYDIGFVVEIMSDGDSFPCGQYYRQEPDELHCAGIWVYWDSTIQVVESQSALAHEISHAVSGDFSHDPGSPSHVCGDMVDGEYNRARRGR